MGGNAIKKSSRINAANLQETYRLAAEILSEIGIKTEHVFPVGSFDKKGPGETYGDIDIAVTHKSLEKIVRLEDFAEEKGFYREAGISLVGLLEDQGLEARWIAMSNLVTFGSPIVDVDGQQPESWAQIDLKLTSKPEFTRWMYHSADPSQSRWKGLYRNILLMAIANEARKEILETEAGMPASWAADSLDLFTGLKRKEMTLRGKRGLVKNPKTLSRRSYEWGRDVKSLVEYLLGPDVSIDKSMTFEDVWGVITDPEWQFSHRLPAIKDEFIRKLGDKPVPPEV